MAWEDPLEEEMATYYSILAWEIPWTEAPGQLQSMGSQRVGHNSTTKQQATTTNRLEEIKLFVLYVAMWASGNSERERHMSSKENFSKRCISDKIQLYEGFNSLNEPTICQLLNFFFPYTFIKRKDLHLSPEGDRSLILAGFKELLK